MAPECIAEQKYSTKSDVWSYGVLCYEVLERQEPWKGQQLGQVMPVLPQVIISVTTQQGHVPISPNYPRAIQKIMTKCFRFSPEERVSFRSILKTLATA